VRGRLHHAPCVAARTHPAPLARIRRRRRACDGIVAESQNFGLLGYVERHRCAATLARLGRPYKFSYFLRSGGNSRPEIGQERVVIGRSLLERLVALSGDDLQPRTRNLRRQLAPEALGQTQVELAHRDERRHRDGAHTVVGVVLEQCVGLAAERH